MKRLILIIILNTSGILYSQFFQNWVAIYNSPLNGLDNPNSMCIDLSGNVFITGQANFSTYTDVTTVKYPGNQYS